MLLLCGSMPCNGTTKNSGIINMFGSYSVVYYLPCLWIFEESPALIKVTSDPEELNVLGLVQVTASCVLQTSGQLGPHIETEQKNLEPTDVHLALEGKALVLLPVWMNGYVKIILCIQKIHLHR